MSKPLVTNAADGKQVELAERKERDRAKQIAKDCRDVMELVCGRRLVYRLLDRAGIWRVSYAGDTNQTMFNEGQRNMGLALLDDLNRSCPDLYLTMMAEAQPAQGEDDAPRE